MTNNPNPTPTRRVRRNNIIKNVFLVLMAVAIVVLAIFVLKGCNKDTAIDTTPGVISPIGCTTCIGECTCTDNSALLVEIDLLKAERDALKAENETLKSGATADDKALAEANANAAAWKSKYDNLYKTHSACTSVDLSKYVTVDDYNKLVNEYNVLVGKYNDLDQLHKACGNSKVDLSKYVLKSTYDELVTNYNKVTAEFATFKQNHTNCNGLTYVEADHSNCVAKSTYQAVLNELAGWRNHVCTTNHNGCVSVAEYNALGAKYQAALSELAQWKNHKCTIDHSGCVAVSEYNALNAKYQTALSRISTLEAEVAQLKAHKCPNADHTTCNSKIKSLEAEICELKADLAKLESHQCDHSNCGTGTTVIQADHSKCVSLRDYNELLAAYNALLND